MAQILSLFFGAFPGTDSTKKHIFDGSVNEGAFIFFVLFIKSDILKKEQLGFGQIADYLKLEYASIVETGTSSIKYY